LGERFLGKLIVSFLVSRFIDHDLIQPLGYSE
jgi:hypothetical protein